MYVHVCVCTCMYMYVYVHACTCTCMYVCFIRSLLVYLRKDHTFYHYDSSASSNSVSARMLFRKLKPAFAGA